MDEKTKKELQIIEYAGVLLAVINVALILRSYTLRNKLKQ
jgi:Flp pilus assembly pilin Flp